MSAKAESARTPMWQRLYEAIHGSSEVIDPETAAAAAARQAAIEEAARQLGALEDVEEQRQERRP